jgi:hypothetical protein
MSLRHAQKDSHPPGNAWGNQNFSADDALDDAIFGDADLQRVIDAWPDLTDATRQQIVALVTEATK